MDIFAEMVTTFFFMLLLAICIFVIVHLLFKINQTQYTFKRNTKNKQRKNREITQQQKLIAITLALAIGLIFKIVSDFNQTTKKTTITTPTQEKTIELQNSLSLVINSYEKDFFETDEDLAYYLNTKIPIKTLYNIDEGYEEINRISKYEILQYKLDDFANKPTLLTYDGVLLSIIKFKNNCKYTNEKQIAKSDCIIEIDLNHYDTPNQIGKDRVLFAIDGINKEVKADTNFLR